MDTLWSYLYSDAHRSVVGWYLGGLVALISGMWQVYKFVKKDNKNSNNANNGLTTNIHINNSRNFNSRDVSTRKSE